MADIAASDVTYTIVKQRTLSNSEKSNVVKLVFGNGALTVGSGGIPLTLAKMGLPTTMDSFKVVDQGLSGYVFQYNKATGKLVVLFADYDAVADGALIATTAAIAAQTIEAEVIGW